MHEEKTAAPLFPAAGARFKVHIERLGADFNGVRLPADSEWFTFRRRTRSLTKQEEINEVAATLCKRLMESPPSDDEVAATLLDRLTNCTYEEVDYTDRQFLMDFQTLPGYKTSITMKIPTLKQEREARDMLQTGVDEQDMTLRLFKDLVSDTLGYAAEPPAWHKHMALIGMLIGLNKVNDGDSVEVEENFTEP